MKRNQKRYWGIIFVTIFLLSQSHILIGFSNRPSWLGFPMWLWYLIGIHVLFIAALYFYMQKAKND